MKQTIFILTLIFGSLISCAPDNSIDLGTVSPIVDDVGSNWQLVWYDDFLGSELDSKKWNITTGTGNWGWGNGELQSYQPENISLHNGILTITAKKENIENSDYSSGRIDTKGLHSIRYGKIEVRAQIPEGEGLWPAFWMLPTKNNWPSTGEIDIMEGKGRLPNTVSGAIHWGTSSDKKVSQGNSFFASIDLTDAFHVYGIEWNEKTITFFIDGSPYASYTITGTQTDGVLNPFGNDPDNNQDTFYLILNLAVGGQFDNFVEPKSSFTSAKLLVDWVRVAKQK